MLACGAKEHTGRGFPALASIVPVMRTNVDIKHLDSVCLQSLHHSPVDGLDRSRAHHAARDTGLVRQYYKSEPGSREPAHRFNGFFDPVKVLPPRDVFATRRSAADCPITIDQQNAFHRQITLGKLPAIRIRDAVIWIAADHA